MIGKYLPKVSNANTCLKLFCFQTAIFDLSQLGTSKKEEFRVFRGLHERKASLMQLEISFYKVKENIFLIYMLQKFLPEYNTSISNWVGRKIMCTYIYIYTYGNILFSLSGLWFIRKWQSSIGSHFLEG